jgi:hypothetical protein
MIYMANNFEKGGTAERYQKAGDFWPKGFMM